MKIVAVVKRVPGDRTRAATGWQVRLACAGPPRLAFAPRELKRGSHGYPLPPPEEKDGWAGLPHAKLCPGPGDEPVNQLHRDVVVGEQDGAGVKTFGGYLTAVLFGPHWARVRDAAPGPIELDLWFGAEDTDLQRLPWEMMIDGDEPLGASHGRTVAIARRVAGTPPAVAPLELPLRVLFVLGHRAETTILSGTEYVSLLRRVSLPVSAAPYVTPGPELHVRLLPDATSRRLTAALREFRPQVVHFICHGQKEGGRPQVLLAGAGQRAGAGLVPADPCPAVRLVGLLRGDEEGAAAAGPPPAPLPLPQVVVLSACHTARPSDAYLSFAAELVARGVPVAVGMAGEVADGACRLFARAFYSALVRKQPVAAAAALGRRAAVLHYGDFLTNVEWARPTLFLAQKVPPAFDLNTARQELAKAAGRCRVLDDSTLCDRFDSYQEYDALRRQLFGGGRQVVLAYEVPGQPESLLGSRQKGLAYQLGKSWLLKAILPHAVLDGLVPCYFGSYVLRTPEVPASLLQFALQLAEDMDEVREKYQVPRRQVSEVLRTALAVLGEAFDPKAPGPPLSVLKSRVIAQAGRPDGALKVLDNVAVRDALRLDLAALLADVRGRVGEARACLVLVDDLDRFEGVAKALLGLVGDYGLGDAAAPAGLILTYSSGRGAGGEIKEALRDRPAQARVHLLQRFRSPDEARLAYTQYLLSLSPPLSLSARADKKEWLQDFFDQFETLAQGVPSYVDVERNEKLAGVIEFAQRPRVKLLIKADDAAIVTEWR
ncbi:MAG TPA: CHAT domain-containing protein [Gemmataceae bacterium]|nr:CHAT domain-containing protein [Gemmataceae bacterium]